MTQPNGSPENGDQDLLRRLTEAPAQAVEDAAKQVDPYSEADDANDKRRSRADVRRTLHKIRKRFFWFLFWALCTIISVLSVGYIYLIWLWVSNLIWGTKLHDAAALKSFIDGVLWSLLIVFATLFLEGTFKDKDD